MTFSTLNSSEKILTGRHQAAELIVGDDYFGYELIDYAASLDELTEPVADEAVHLFQVLLHAVGDKAGDRAFTNRLALLQNAITTSGIRPTTYENIGFQLENLRGRILEAVLKNNIGDAREIETNFNRKFNDFKLGAERLVKSEYFQAFNESVFSDIGVEATEFRWTEIIHTTKLITEKRGEIAQADENPEHDSDLRFLLGIREKAEAGIPSTVLASKAAIAEIAGSIFAARA